MRRVGGRFCSFDDLVNYGVLDVEGTYILEYKDHLTTVIDGIFHDSVDMRTRKVKQIWSG